MFQCGNLSALIDFPKLIRIPRGVRQGYRGHDSGNLFVLDRKLIGVEIFFENFAAKRVPPGGGMTSREKSGGAREQQPDEVNFSPAWPSPGHCSVEQSNPPRYRSYFT